MGLETCQQSNIKNENFFHKSDKKSNGVLTVTLGVKNLSAAAQVTAQGQVQSLAWHSGLKDPAWQKLWYRSQLQLRFNTWPRNFHKITTNKQKTSDKKNTKGTSGMEETIEI